MRKRGFKRAVKAEKENKRLWTPERRAKFQAAIKRNKERKIRNSETEKQKEIALGYITAQAIEQKLQQMPPERKSEPEQKKEEPRAVTIMKRGDSKIGGGYILDGETLRHYHEETVRILVIDKD